jgi:hypothetical protein
MEWSSRKGAESHLTDGVVLQEGDGDVNELALQERLTKGQQRQPAFQFTRYTS